MRVETNQTASGITRMEPVPFSLWLHLGLGVWQARRGKLSTRKWRLSQHWTPTKCAEGDHSVSSFLQGPNSTQITLAYSTLSQVSLSQSARMSSTPFFLRLCPLPSLHSLKSHPRPVPFLWEDCNSVLTDLLAPDSSS